MEKVGSLKASCLEANGELDKFRERLMQYGDDIQDNRMSLEQWQSERGNSQSISVLNMILSFNFLSRLSTIATDTLQSSLDQAIENTCGLQRQQVRAMAELQQNYESASSELEVLRQRYV